jgi:hypothetical protein
MESHLVLNVDGLISEVEDLSVPASVMVVVLVEWRFIHILIKTFRFYRVQG